jgi:hypothetical protein
MQQKLAT